MCQATVVSILEKHEPLRVSSDNEQLFPPTYALVRYGCTKNILLRARAEFKTICGRSPVL